MNLSLMPCVEEEEEEAVSYACILSKCFPASATTWMGPCSVRRCGIHSDACMRDRMA